MQLFSGVLRCKTFHFIDHGTFVPTWKQRKPNPENPACSSHFIPSSHHSMTLVKACQNVADGFPDFRSITFSSWQAFDIEDTMVMCLDAPLLKALCCYCQVAKSDLSLEQYLVFPFINSEVQSVGNLELPLSNAVFLSVEFSDPLPSGCETRSTFDDWWVLYPMLQISWERLRKSWNSNGNLSWHLATVMRNDCYNDWTATLPMKASAIKSLMTFHHPQILFTNHWLSLLQFTRKP